MQLHDSIDETMSLLRWLIVLKTLHASINHLHLDLDTLSSNKTGDHSEATALSSIKSDLHLRGLPLTAVIITILMLNVFKHVSAVCLLISGMFPENRHQSLPLLNLLEEGRWHTSSWPFLSLMETSLNGTPSGHVLSQISTLIHCIQKLTS